MSENILNGQFSHSRSMAALVSAALRPSVYLAVARMLLEPAAGFGLLKRYLTGTGSYPAQFTLRTPTSPVTLTAFVADDVITINEVYFRGDYGTSQNDEVVVDFGANIGISASFFLSRNSRAKIYCYEAFPQNVERFHVNISPFAGRYEIKQVAIAEHDGEVSFNVEPTGRYCGIGSPTDETMIVPCVDSNNVLREIISKHGRIDLVKIDIEKMEKIVTDRIPEDVARNIGRLVVEEKFDGNPLAATHDMHYSKPITTFTLKQATGS